MPGNPKGIRELPEVKDHPEWWFVLHLDGPQLTFAAQQVFADHKILLVKENAFDQAPAKLSKLGLHRWLPFARQLAIKGGLDQWQLLCVVLDAHKDGWADAWISGFKRVNGWMRFRRPFGHPVGRTLTQGTHTQTS